MAHFLERPGGPARRRLDVDAYYRMAQAGILGASERVELIDGEIIDMNAIGSVHAALVSRLNRAFAPLALSGRALVSVQNPLRLDSYNEPEPDLMLLRPRADDYAQAHPGTRDVLLLVEVADSSLAYDRTCKLALYAQFAVHEVWIVDIAGAAVEIYRDPSNGRYLTTLERARGAIAPALAQGAEVDLDALFK